ncbi:Rieske (2Fe-2S) protein [Arachnia propionica]|uniref:Rieske (2Fe-2S) protein n=1 Tax=Arachnia propionica TaxID=1750 RepID=UPI000F703AD9|nr:Rieske (2Fe-2S) protein [Arachnia propionica]VEJ59728.1 Rieske [2Fe-2S] domain [Arachnia propionica]
MPVGGGTLIGWYVVTQPVAGTFHAYYAACPHAGLKVDRIEGQKIVCNSHGARFSTDNGAVLKGSAKKSLTPAPFTTDGDILIITMPKDTE